MLQLEKDIVSSPPGAADGDRAKSARAEADAARERAETIQRSRNCEWLRLRWHAVATCVIPALSTLFAVQDQLLQRQLT